MLNNGTSVLHIHWRKVDKDMPCTAKYHYRRQSYEIYVGDWHALYYTLRNTLQLYLETHMSFLLLQTP